MSSYVLTPRAKADIFHIWAYIADHNQDAADRVEQAIFDACAFLAETPMRGHCRPDLTGRPLRFWTLSRYPNYVIVYRPDNARFRSLLLCMEREISSAFSSSASDSF
jgi:antitoxin ParD1/3/4